MFAIVNGPAGHEGVDRTVGAIVFDWDGTAVPDRRASARRIRWRLERLSRHGVHAAVVSGTHLGNIDGQLRARPGGPGRLFLALNRGSELFEVTETGPVLIRRREETVELGARLDRAAAMIAGRLQEHGLAVELVSRRLNRRKIDLIPERDWREPPKSRIVELLAAVQDRVGRAGFGSIVEIADLAVRIAASCGIASARVTSDVKHIELGVTDKSDSMDELLDLLDGEGVSGELLLVVGDEFGDVAGMPGSDALLRVPGCERADVISVGVEPNGVPAGVRHLGGGPDTFVGLVDDQLRRAARCRVPTVCRDPAWTIVERGVDLTRHRVTESLFTTTSGAVGLRGSVEDSPDYGQPLVVANGVYSGAGIEDGLLPGPDVIDVRIVPPVREDVRILDLRTGVLHREESGSSGVPMRSTRFGSLMEPGVFALRVEAGIGRLRLPGSSREVDRWNTTSAEHGSIGAVVDQETHLDRGVRAIQRIVAFDASTATTADPARARRRLVRARSRGFDELLSAQRAGWAARWERVGIHLPSDPESELRLRFDIYQLWNLGVSGAEVAVGARGLTGAGYSGHVFWDADVFVLPALVTVDPVAAAGMVAYRLHRLRAAQERAHAEGRCGARFPWESALDGRDVTPNSGYVGGESVPILTGTREAHITADVAWAAARLAQWTRPDGALTAAEAELIGETARYWASTVRVDPDGRAHIDDVIGPDEYHEAVDDNAFTNVMARWNLRAAARSGSGNADERRSWLRTAEALVDGYDTATGLYEQFRGYFKREPLLVREIAQPPVAADVLAGRDRIARSQVIKQPDVLMLHHLVPTEVQPGSLTPNLDYYGPRTAHGSSLSLAIMAALEARGGRPDAALELLRMNLRIDLDDLGGTTSAGVHVGACGGAWQALLFGFLGAQVRDGILQIDPVLPAAWPSIEVRFCCLGRDVRVRVADDRVQVESSGPLRVRVASSLGLWVEAGANIHLVAGGTV